MVMEAVCVLRLRSGPATGKSVSAARSPAPAAAIHRSLKRGGRTGKAHVTGGSRGSMGDSGTGKEEAKRTGLPLQGGSHGNLRSAASDEQLKQMLDSVKSSKSPAVISYGASWCRVCSQILPSFSKFSNEFKNLTFIYADIDECPETTQSIRYTPTFHFYRDGERVDEMLGTGEERLHDRLWLHS